MTKKAVLLHKIFKVDVMKKFFLSLFLLSTITLQAETIKGSVKDVNGHPMPFVTISVLDKDSTLLTGDITDEQGKYIITPPGLPTREEIGLNEPKESQKGSEKEDGDYEIAA